MDRLMSISKAADILGLNPATLREWDANGKLKAVITPGGHRRFKESDLKAFMGEKNDVQQKQPSTIKVATYARVSSHEQKQKGDLDRQSQRLSEYCAKKKYKVENIIKDVGSGLSDTRIGFLKLIDLCIEGEINKVVVENKDRLTRFQFGVLDKFFSSYGTDIELVENQEVSDEMDLVNDIMMLMASFSGKLYGRRSAKRRAEKKLTKISKHDIVSKNKENVI